MPSRRSMLLPSRGERLYLKVGDTIGDSHYRAVAAALLVQEVFHELKAPLADAQARVIELLAQDPEEVRAWQIVVATKPEAEAIISKLVAGADFVSLASKWVADPADGPCRGDLGYRRKNDLHPALADAIFALGPRSFNLFPVQTPLGWHVVKVVDRRQRLKRITDRTKKWRNRNRWRLHMIDHEANYPYSMDPKVHTPLALTPKEFQVLFRRRLADKGYGQIATDLRITVAEVKRLQQAAEEKTGRPAV